MAVTADYDAAKWPDMAAATATDWAPVLALERALEERWAVVRGLAQSERQYDALPGYISPLIGLPPKQSAIAERCSPLLSRLAAIKSQIERLSYFFIDLDDEEMHHSVSGYAGFPRLASFYHVFRKAGPNETDPGSILYGDHALVLLPEEFCTDFDDESLDAYRQWLCNAAWWLDRFRYVAPIENSLFFRMFYGEDGEGGERLEKTADWDAPEETDVTEALEGETETGLWRFGAWSAAGRVPYQLGATSFVRIVHELSVTTNGVGWGGTRTESAQVELCRSKLQVNNTAPLAANAWLYLAPVSRPTRTKTRKWTAAVDPNAWTCVYHELSTTEVWYDGWKETERIELLAEREGFNHTASCTITTTTKTYSDSAGTLVDTQTDAEEDYVRVPSYPTDIFSWSETNALVDDSDYPSDMGGRIHVGTIQPYSHAEALPERDVAPMPAVWNLDAKNEAQWSADIGGSFTAAATTEFSLVPILDYYDSFKNGKDEWDPT